MQGAKLVKMVGEYVYTKPFDEVHAVVGGPSSSEPLRAQIVSAHLKCYQCVETKAFVQGFKFQTEAAEYVDLRASWAANSFDVLGRRFFDMLGTDRDTNWWLPAMNTVCLQLRLSAYRVSAALCWQAVLTRSLATCQADEDKERKGDKTKHAVRCSVCVASNDDLFTLSCWIAWVALAD